MAKVFFTLILAVAAIALTSAKTSTPVKSERELRQDLFRGYNKYARPVKKHSSTVTVKIALTPMALRSMDIKDQLISLETWMNMNWTDEYLRWHPSDYDDINMIPVSLNEIWKPDVAVYTASPDTSLYPVVQTQALVDYTGLVKWAQPFTINSRCPIPFHNCVTTGRQFVDCNIRLGSFRYIRNLMDVQLATDEVDLKYFKDYHHEYKLVKIVAKVKSNYQPKDYSLVNYNVTLNKRNYYTNFEAES